MTSIGDQLVSALRSQGVEVELVEPGVPMPTVPAAAEAVGVSESSIIKSVLFEDRAGQVVLAIANGRRRISRTALATAAGFEKLWLAPPPLVLEKTGFAAGGVAPIGHAFPISVIVDHRVMDEEWVFGGAGSEEALLKLRPRDIVRLTSASIADIVETRTS